MAGVKQTLAAFMATHFGKSEKVISEKLSTEEHNEFTADALKLQEQVTALETDKTSLEGERDTLAAEKTALEGKVTALEGERDTLAGDKTTLQNSLKETETDRDKYKGWYDKQKGKGTQLPDNDATNKESGSMTDYNADAMAVFRKYNPAK